MIDLATWEPRFAAYLDSSPLADAAHDRDHIRRVVSNARALAAACGASQEVVIPAAWLHDCVAVPKDSPQRPLASTMAATTASAYLAMAGYPPMLIPAIAHAIAAHSFSAGIAPLTLEARVVQDADRLDALGAVGVARCLMLGAQLGRPLYQADEPFPVTRPADDAVSSIDHFYTKLLGLAETMATDAGRAEAGRRTAFMRDFLRQLGHEIGVPAPE
ncbi:HD domain-containing protein [Oscillochloris sp. ZM17-4]|uniref:HD domain-containing protein n=1 Tax=Oscillochloris sp. ZM17-4 TaxID=2866714 RepID=UPI001C73793B|nr:HD domain-containing protein [Oscillochloris sp. ZM17-4]MBX0329461.1 HD domain-containing protein [Oscillochloris sp. ZM17-4]